MPGRPQPFSTQLPLAADLPHRAPSHPLGDEPCELVHQAGPLGFELGAVERGAQQLDTAGDVEPDAAGIDIDGGDATGQEAVPQCTCGIASEAATIPGNVATLAT